MVYPREGRVSCRLLRTFDEEIVEWNEGASKFMCLIQLARLNGYDPHAYLKDVLTRLVTQKNNRIAELLPRQWTPAA